MSGDTRRTRARSKNAVRKSSEGERKNGDALRNGKSKRLDFALDATKGTTEFSDAGGGGGINFTAGQQTVIVYWLLTWVLLF
jgi:hypothetical protein